MQHLLHEDTYLKQPWQAAIQWLHYEMERVSCDNVGTARCVILLFASQSFGCSILASDIEVVSNSVNVLFLFSSSSVLMLAQATVMLGGLRQHSLMKLLMGKALLTILNHPYLH